MTSDAKIKVLFISGVGRSGSTILGNILGEVEGFFCGGEILNIFKRYPRKNRPCGCGELLPKCPVWSGIFNRAFDRMQKIDLSKMIEVRKKYVAFKNMPTLVSSRARSRNQDLDEYLQNVEKLYREIHKATQCSVIVDGSKSLPYVTALKQIPSLEIYMVHLIRDPRAVAFSWLRKKRLFPGAEESLPTKNPVTSSLKWTVRNSINEVLWRQNSDHYMRVHYRSFVTQTKTTVTQILDMLDEKNRALPFVGERSVTLNPNHTVDGNPGRFNHGVVELKTDDEWKHRMQIRDRFVVNFLTWPLLIKYGYL